MISFDKICLIKVHNNVDVFVDISARAAYGSVLETKTANPGQY